MKKSIIAAVVLVAGAVFTANAQSKEGQVTVNINLHKFQTLTVNDAQVNIDFKTKEHYENGATSGEMQNHLTVSSTGSFVVKAKSVVANPNSVTNKTLGGGGALTVTTKNGSSNTLENATFTNNINLNDSQTIVSANKGQFNKNVNVEYKANSGTFTGMNLINNGYLDNNSNVTTYKVLVTYSIDVN